MAVIVIMNTVGCSRGKMNSKGPDSQEIQYRIISVEDYEDKVAGGWLGKLQEYFGLNTPKVSGRGK